MTVARGDFINALKDRIEANPTQRVRHVYETTVAQLPIPDVQDDEDFVTEFRQLKTALNRKKREFYPPIPHRMRDVNITDSWSETWSHEQFVCFQDKRWGFVIFLTERNCSRLAACEEIFIDGTFKCSPKPFTQLLTIHGRYLGRILPMAFCLLRGKEVGLYQQVLKRIKQRIRHVTRQEFDIRRCICDFEISLIRALQTEFPRVTVKGCYFHFTQSIWRRIQKLGLATAYKRSKTFGNFAKQLMALAYLPTALVRQNFQLLHTSNTIRRMIRRFPAAERLINYFNSTYILGQFRPAMWNVFNRYSTCRTNNHVEGNFSCVTKLHLM